MRFTKRMMVLAMAAMAMLALSGCTKSSISDDVPFIEGENGEEIDPAKLMDDDDDETLPRDQNKLIEVDVEPESIYDWDQATAESGDLFADKNMFPLAAGFTYKADEAAHTVELNWMLDASATEEDALEYAADMVMRFNDIIAVQTTDMEMSSDKSFGGLWKEFALHVTIVRSGDSVVLLDKSYAAGEKIDLPLPVYSNDGPQDVEEDVPKKG